MRNYSLREEAGNSVSKRDAQALGEALERLQERLIRPITPRDLVEEAKSLSSPFHRYFEWDDKRAALNYRIDQARGLLRSLDVELPEYGDAKVRAYIPMLHGTGNEGYMPTEQALISRPDVIAGQLRHLKDEAQRISETYGGWYRLVNGPAKEFLGTAFELSKADEKELVKAS